MTDLKKVPEIENKKSFKDKNLFKRFKINLKDFEIEKSDFDEKLLDKKYDKKNIHDLDIDNKNSDDQEGEVSEFGDDDFVFSDDQEGEVSEFGDDDFVFSDDQEGEVSEFGDDDFVFSDDQEKIIEEFKEDLILINNDTKENFKDHHDNSDQELLSSEEDENEKLSLSSKIKKIASKYSKRKFPILPILGLFIGIFFVITGVLIFLGNSDKIVDNVISGETNTLSVLITFIGIIFFVFSLLKISSSKRAFGSMFHIIKDFETEINESNENNPKYQEEDLIIKEVDVSFDEDSKS